MYPSPDPRIFCLLQSTSAHPGLAAAEPPPGLLSAAEQARCEKFAVPKRRRDWLLGRWTAKHLVRAYLAEARDRLVPLDEIEVLAGDDGAPYVQVGEPLPLSLSISHSGVESFCAVCRAKDGHVGADIEQVEPRETGLVHTFFTPAEIAVVDAAVASERDAYITAIWSAKEAVLKTLRLGLRADTRQVEVAISRLSPEWRAFSVVVDSRLLPSPVSAVAGWSRIDPRRVLSLAMLALG